MLMKTAVILLALSCTALGQPAPAPKNYTVLQDTDFFGFNAGARKTQTFEECAQLCWESSGCMCVSWNGPQSTIKDLNCNMHCSTKGKRSDKGEVAGA